MTAGSGSDIPQQMISTSAYTYSVFLRVRHPSLDPAVFTRTLHLEPEHSWKAGEPREGSGSGQYRESYWSARLPDQSVGGKNAPLELVVSQQLLQFNRHREFLNRLQREGGTVSVVVEISPAPSGVLTLSSTVSRRLADLNLELEFQFLEV